MDTNTLIAVLVIVVLIFGVIVFAALRFNSMKASVSKDRFNIEGSNKEYAPPGVQITNAKSRKGKLNIRNNEGDGIRGKNIKAQSDVNIEQGLRPTKGKTDPKL